MDLGQDAVPCPVAEATAGAGGQHEPVPGRAKLRAGALSGSPGSSSQSGVGDADPDPMGVVCRGASRLVDELLSLWLNRDDATRTDPLPPSPAPCVPAALPASISYLGYGKQPACALQVGSREQSAPIRHSPLAMPNLCMRHPSSAQGSQSGWAALQWGAATMCLKHTSSHRAVPVPGVGVPPHPTVGNGFWGSNMTPHVCHVQWC